MNSSHTINEANSTIQIGTLPSFVRAAMLSGFMVIIWNRDGLVRRIPPAVFQNAYRFWRDCETAHKMGRLQAMPPEAGRIQWEQAIEQTPWRAKTSGPPRHQARQLPPPR